MSTLNTEKWIEVLERTFLNFNWSPEAKRHTYEDRYHYTPADVEDVLFSYTNSDPSTQRCRAKTSKRQVIQQEFPDRDQVVRVKKEIKGQPKKKILSIYEKFKLINTKSKTEISDWPEIIFSHYVGTDDLGIYLIKVTPGVYDVSDNATDSFVVSYNHNREIISLDLYEISDLFHKNMFTVDGVLNAKFLNSIYYDETDTLKINFINVNPLPTKIQKTDIDGVEIEMDTAGKITGLLFHDARNKIAKPLTEEEREVLAKKAEEERMGRIKNYKIDGFNRSSK
ncbi:hypothetical protein RclHR1_01510008 [Rhizophagus clarus]|uniref:Uncharacterized protein n=1 Tax=Rhizophagus clarus TaxID=94130 RepID=A0A2Z6QEC9_9GLOM|nr:hypothetical protein RclHR1_01510008 [Rhizophagus clarus]